VRQLKALLGQLPPTATSATWDRTCKRCWHASDRAQDGSARARFDASGEAEILGQVKERVRGRRSARARWARRQSTLFRGALEAGKSARTHTRYRRLDLDRERGRVRPRQTTRRQRRKNVLVIGAASMGALAARRLKVEGAGEIVVDEAARKEARGPSPPNWGRRLHAAGNPTRLIDALAAADVVVTSDRCFTFIRHRRPTSPKAMSVAPATAALIVDLAVPRDVDPEVAGITGVSVVDVDGLQEAPSTSRSRSAAKRSRCRGDRRRARRAVRAMVQSRVAIPVHLVAHPKGESDPAPARAALRARPDLTEPV